MTKQGYDKKKQTTHTPYTLKHFKITYKNTENFNRMKADFTINELSWGALEVALLFVLQVVLTILLMLYYVSINCC